MPCDLRAHHRLFSLLATLAFQLPEHTKYFLPISGLFTFKHPPGALTQYIYVWLLTLWPKLNDKQLKRTFFYSGYLNSDSLYCPLGLLGEGSGED